MARDGDGGEAGSALVSAPEGAAPDFNFCRPSAVARRRRLLKESVDAIIRDGDVDRLLSHVDDVQHADIEPGEVGYGPLHKGLHVMQYASQYLVYTQGVLRDKEGALRERERGLEEQVKRIRRTHGIQREHCKRLRRGDKHLDELLDQHHAMLRAVNPALARRCVLHENGVLEQVGAPEAVGAAGLGSSPPPEPEEGEEVKRGPSPSQEAVAEETEVAPAPVPERSVAEVETQTTPKGDAEMGGSPRRWAPTKYRGPAPPDEPPPPDAVYRPPPAERPAAHRRGYEAPPPSMRLPGSGGEVASSARAAHPRSSAPLADTVRRGDGGGDSGRAARGADTDGEVAVAGEDDAGCGGASGDAPRPSAALLDTGHSVSWGDENGGALVAGGGASSGPAASSRRPPSPPSSPTGEGLSPQPQGGGESSGEEAAAGRGLQLRTMTSAAAAASASATGATRDPGAPLNAVSEWEEGDDVLLGTAQSAMGTGTMTGTMTGRRGARRAERPLTELTPPPPQYDPVPGASPSASWGGAGGSRAPRPSSASARRSVTGRWVPRKPYRELSDEEGEEGTAGGLMQHARTAGAGSAAGDPAADADAATATAAARRRQEGRSEDVPSLEWPASGEDGAADSGTGPGSESDYGDEHFEESEAPGEMRGTTSPAQAFASPLGTASDSPARRSLHSAAGMLPQRVGDGADDDDDDDPAASETSRKRTRKSAGHASVPEPAASPREPRAEATASSEELFWRGSAETGASDGRAHRSADQERGPVRQAIAAAAAAAAEESAEGSSSLLSPPPTHAPDVSAEEARSSGEAAGSATPPRESPPARGPRSGPLSGRAAGRRRARHGGSSSAKGSQGASDSLLDSSLLTEGRLVGEEGTSMAEEGEGEGSAVLSASHTSPEPSPAGERARGPITHMDSPSPDAGRPRSTHSATGLRMSPRRLVEGLDDPSTPSAARYGDEEGAKTQEELTPRPGRLPPRPSSSSRLSGPMFANGHSLESEQGAGAAAGHAVGSTGDIVQRWGDPDGMVAVQGSPRQRGLDPAEALCIRVSQIRLAERARTERPSRIRVVYRVLGRVWVATPWTAAPPDGTLTLTHATMLDLSDKSLALEALRAAFEAEDDRRSLPASDVEDPGDEERASDRGGGWEEPNIVFRVLRQGGDGDDEETVGASRLSLHTLLDEGRDLTHRGLRLVSPAGQPMGTLVCSVEGAEALARAL